MIKTNAVEALIHSEEPMWHSFAPLIYSVRPLIRSAERVIHSATSVIHSVDLVIHSVEPLIHSVELLIHSVEASSRVHRLSSDFYSFGFESIRKRKVSIITNLTFSAPCSNVANLQLDLNGAHFLLALCFY